MRERKASKRATASRAATMNKLRGIGPKFGPIEHANLTPHFNPRVLRQNAKRARLVKAGLTPTAQERADLIARAVTAGAARKIPPGASRFKRGN